MRGIKTKGSGKWKKISIFIILIVLLVVLLNSARKVYEKKVEVQNTLTRMQAEVTQLQNRDQVLKESIKSINTKEGLEFELRQKLNVAQAGEGVAVIVDQPQPTSTSITAISPWQKIVNLFTGLFK
jgi:cell division protein FtsB